MSRHEAPPLRDTQAILRRRTDTVPAGRTGGIITIMGVEDRRLLRGNKLRLYAAMFLVPELMRTHQSSKKRLNPRNRDKAHKQRRKPAPDGVADRNLLRNRTCIRRKIFRSRANARTAARVNAAAFRYPSFQLPKNRALPRRS